MNICCFPFLNIRTNVSDVTVKLRHYLHDNNRCCLICHFQLHNIIIRHLRIKSTYKTESVIYETASRAEIQLLTIPPRFSGKPLLLTNQLLRANTDCQNCRWRAYSLSLLKWPKPSQCQWRKMHSRRKARHVLKILNVSVARKWLSKSELQVWLCLAKHHGQYRGVFMWDCVNKDTVWLLDVQD